MSAQPFVSIIIPTYNQPVYLKECVQSLLEQSYPSNCFELIVIDDASEIPAAGLLAEFHLPAEKLTVIRHAENRGSGAARQSGLQAARGEYLASTDDDCLYHREWLMELVRGIGSNAGAGGSVGVLEKYSFFQKLFAVQSNLGHARVEGEVVVSIPGSNALYKRQTVLDAGGYTTDRTIAEDRELNVRIKNAGGEFILIKSAVAYPVPKEDFIRYFRWKVRVGDHCHQLIFKRPGSYPEDWSSMMRGLPYNPLALVTFPAVLVRLAWNALTLPPAAVILGSLWLLRLCRVNENFLFWRMRARDTGWAVRTMDRQFTDLGVIFSEMKRRLNPEISALQKAESC